MIQGKRMNGKRCQALLLCASLALGASAASESTLEFKAFGKVTIYTPSAPSTEVALFISGDGGWNAGVVDMARQLQSLGALVVGIDITHYLKNVKPGKTDCLYSAADFEALSQFVQKKLGLSDYRPPLIVGYSSGATLAYALLAQAPIGTFSGALSLGFCPDLMSAKPLCKGSGLTNKKVPKLGYVYDPKPDLGLPWNVLQGDIDKVCDPPSTKRYVEQIASAKMFWLPKVGHGYSVPKNWMPQFIEAYRELAGKAAKNATSAPVPKPRAAVEPIDDLPLVDVPAGGSAKKLTAFLLSGDGGWSGMDRQIASALADDGVHTVGWNSLKYYWKPRTPDSAAADLARILRHQLADDPEQRAVIIGYSLGADVSSFLVNRLPEDLKARIALLALIAPGQSVAFEFHLSNWTGGKQDDALPTLPEAKKLAGVRLLCLYGTDEDDSLCPQLPAGLATIDQLPGGHHFGGDYKAVAQRILAAAKL